MSDVDETPQQQRQAGERRSRWVAVGGAAIAALVFLLTFSDRAPSYTVDNAGQVRRYGSALERITGIDLIDRADVPFEIDEIGHFVLWFMMGATIYAVFAGRRLPRLLGGGAIPHWVLVAAVAVLAVSFEVGQAVLTFSRNLSAGDGAANLVGGLVGYVAAAFLTLSVRRIGGPGRGVRRVQA